MIAAAAAFVKADGLRACAPTGLGHDLIATVPPDARKGLTESSDSKSKQESPDPAPKDQTSGSGATFIAVRPEVQDQGGASLRRLCPREPVSGLHQPVAMQQPSQHPALALDAERPAEPDLMRVIARPILRHGPPLTSQS